MDFASIHPSRRALSENQQKLLRVFVVAFFTLGMSLHSPLFEAPVEQKSLDPVFFGSFCNSSKASKAEGLLEDCFLIL